MLYYKQMNPLIQKLKRFTLLFMSFALFAFFPASVLTMNHSAMDTPIAHHGTMTGQSVSQSAPDASPDQCVVYHLGLLDTLCASVTQFSNLMLFIMALLVFSILGSIDIRKNLDLINRSLLFKLQKLKPVAHEAFMAAIGNWLNLIQKKSPAYAFAIA
jgi:hypothetical protein